MCNKYILSKGVAAATCLTLLLGLGGCAIERMHNSGMELIHQGHIEDGLQKLKKASDADPDNLPYRNDYLRTRDQVTVQLLAEATTEMSLGHLDAAKQVYERVLAIDHDNRNARRGLEMVAMRERHSRILEEARELIKKGDLEEARGTLNPLLIEDQNNEQAINLIRQIDEREAKDQAAEPILTGKFRTPVSLAFRDANIKMLFEALARMAGINVLVDKDVKSDLKATIFVNDVSVADAIDLILMQAQLEKKVLSNNTIYIYPNSAQKIKEYKDLKVRSFHLIYADATRMMNVIKALLKTKDIIVHDKTNSLIMRDTPDAIHLAEKLVADQDIPDPEVMLEVEVLEVTRARLRDLGIQFPTNMTLTTMGNGAPAATGGANTLTLAGLKATNSSTISVTPAPALTLNAMLQDGDTNILSSPRLRVKNHEKAKIMIGERVPIITNSVTPITGGTGSVVTGSVSYQDVGLKFDVEPDIHLADDVTIKLGLEVSSLGQAVTTTSGSQVYIVGTRNTSTSLRLHDGETQILAGLITDNDTSTVDKVPLLGQIPLLGHLFSNDNSNKTKTEILLSITPHIIGGKKILDARDMEFWSGTDAELQSRQLVLKQLGEVSVTGPNASTSPVKMPGVPGAGAASAAKLGGLPPAVPVPFGGAASGVAAAPAGAAAVSPASGAQPAAPATQENAAAQNGGNPSAGLSWSGPARAKVGDKISLALNAQSLRNVKKFDFDVGFDPSVLKFIDVNAGDGMKQDNAASSLNKVIDQADGSITLGLTGRGRDGGGSVVVITFQIAAPAEGTTVTINSINGTMENGASELFTAPEPYSVVAE